MRKTKLLNKGFTIVELAVVIAVIGILAAVVSFGYNGLQANARDKSLLSDIDAVESELGRYASKNGGYDDSLNWDSSTSVNANIQFTPSSGNTIIVKVMGDGYCVKAYNPQSNSKTLDTAVTKGSCVWKWTKVAAGQDATCGIATNAKVYCWGRNDNSALGDGTANNSSVPVPVDMTGVLANKTIKDLAVGGSGACVIASDNLPYCWGFGMNGLLGDGTFTTQQPTPVAVTTTGALAGKTVSAITMFSGTACVIASDSQVYCWGYGYYGGLGNGSTSNSNVPVLATGALVGKTVTQIRGSGWGSHVCATASDGNAYCWGSGSYGLLGNNSTSNTTTPVMVIKQGALTGKTIKQVAGNSSSSCALTTDNVIACWGLGSTGDLGTGVVEASINYAPLAVTMSGALAGKQIESIAPGCATTTDNKGYCWGSDTSGSVGNGAAGNALAPVEVTTFGALAGKQVKSIFKEGRHACALGVDGIAYCWGRSDYGQVGNGTTSSAIDVPALVKEPN